MAGKKQKVFAAWTKPDFKTVVKTHKNYTAGFQAALNYAHYELTSSDLKKEVVKYLKTLDPKNPLLDDIKSVHENRFTSIGKYVYILNNGGDLPDDISVKLLSEIEKIIDENKEKKNAIESVSKGEGQGTASNAIVISIQERLREKARSVAGEVEGWIDDFCLDKSSPVKTVEDFVNLFKANDLKAPHMRHMHSIFERRANHIELVASGKDKELLEGYSNFTKAELKKFSTFHQNLLSACSMLQEVAKVVRAPRKKKPVSVEKQVSKLKYKKDDTTLGIVSVNPSQIVGSKEVWVYNTKTRKLGQYKASDERGLAVKGASFINFSTDSVEKTLRKPAETLSEFKKASKVKLRTFMKDIATLDTKLTGKLNEHVVILRIDK